MKNIKRVFLKISGEALAGASDGSLDHDYIRKVCRDLIELQSQGLQIAIMVGGGNFFRGRHEGKGIDPAIGHYSGILAGVMNSLVVQNILYQEGGEASIFSAIEMPRIVKTFNKIAAVKRLERGMIVICAGGTGNPFCSHDLGSSVRALELDCDIMIKCTNVDGVYTADPKKDPAATRYTTLTYKEALSQGLQIMDQSALGMAMENNLTSFVCHIDDIAKCVSSWDHGTLITAS